MKTTDASPLLHVCCAPCSGPIIEKMTGDGLWPTVFFYNPNISPPEEYECRKSSVIAFVRKKGLRFIDIDPDTEYWLDRVKGFEKEPERGRRCTICFDVRLERTALYAHENGFRFFATTNGIARWKDLEQVNQSGLRAAARYLDLTFMAINWRDDGGLEKIPLIARREKFYRQEYCGCLFSLRTTNERRQASGIPPVQHGKTYYGG